MTSVPAQELLARLDVAVRISKEAGRLTLQYFQTDQFEVERKSDDSPVTIADREAEKLLRSRIADAFPNDGIIGEELGESPGRSGLRWIVDPIDGTKSFVSGVPLYSQLVAVECEGRGVLGVIHIPGLDETVYAAQGNGAWYVRGSSAPRRTAVSKRPLDQGLFVTSQVDSFDKRGGAEAFREVQRRAYITRTWGDGYGYLLVATGRAEVMIDPIMNVWDAAAIQPVLEEAGGTFHSWNGEATIFGGDGVGTNGIVRDEILAITGRFPKPS